jgi:hypothetical protein
MDTQERIKNQFGLCPFAVRNIVPTFNMAVHFEEGYQPRLDGMESGFLTLLRHKSDIGPICEKSEKPPA